VAETPVVGSVPAEVRLISHTKAVNAITMAEAILMIARKSALKAMAKTPKHAVIQTVVEMARSEGSATQEQQ